MDIQEIYAKANNLGIINGEIKILIVNGRIKDAEYLIRVMVDSRPNIDSVVKK